MGDLLYLFQLNTISFIFLNGKILPFHSLPLSKSKYDSLSTEKSKWLEGNKHKFFLALKEDSFLAVIVAQIAVAELVSA